MLYNNATLDWGNSLSKKQKNEMVLELCMWMKKNLFNQIKKVFVQFHIPTLQIPNQ